MAINDSMLTLKEVAKYLHLHPATVYRMLREGKLPGFLVGGDWRFSRTEIDQWRQAQETRAANQKK